MLLKKENDENVEYRSSDSSLWSSILRIPRSTKSSKSLHYRDIKASETNNENQCDPPLKCGSVLKIKPNLVLPCFLRTVR